MFDPADRRALLALRDSLQGVRETVPPRAEEFHRRHSQLMGDLSAQLVRWWWTSRDRIHDLTRGVHHLNAMTVPLHDLFASAAHVQRQIAAMQAAAASSVMSERVAALCARWSAEVGRLGVNAGRSEEIDADKATLAQVAADVRDSREAVALLVEAEALLEKSSAGFLAAPLKAYVPKWWDQVLDNGPTTDLIQELRAAIDPLRQRAEEAPPAPPDPAPGVFEVTAILSDIWQWADSLGDSNTRPVELLAEDLQILEGKAGDHGSDELNTLRDRAHVLRDGYLNHARRRREESCARIEETYRLYQRACGDDPRLSGAINRLRTLSIDAPLHYTDWRQASEQASNQLQAEMGHQRPSLTSALGRALDALKEQIDRTRRQLLSRANRAALERLAATTELQPVPGTLDETIASLRACANAEREVGALDQRAAREREVVEGDRRAVERRIEELEAATRAVHGSPGDLSAKLPQAPTVPEALDVLIDHIALTGRVLEGEEARFLRACRQAIEDDEALGARLRQMLQRVRPDLPLSADEPIEAPRSPLEAAAAVRTARERRDRLTARLQAERHRLEGEVARAAAKLDTLRGAAGRLRPEEAITCERLQREATLAGATEDLVAGVVALMTVLDEAEVFFAHVEKDEREAVRLLGELRDKLGGFNDDGLREYVPELVDRVSGLLEGATLMRASWPAMQAQLAEAARIFEAIDTHARRLAALDLEEARAVLAEAERERSARGGAVDSEAARALAALTPKFADGYALPPPELRARLRRLAPRSPEASRA